MFKRPIFVALASVGLLAAPYASAQMKAYIGGGLGFNTVAANVVAVDPTALPPTTEKTTSGKRNLTGQIEGGVRFDAGNMVYGVGLYVNPLTLKADDVDDGAGFSIKTEIKNLMGLVGELGWKLESATVAYGKLSFNQAKVEAKVTDPPLSGTISKTFTGFGVGAGVRHALANNMYLFVDWHHIMGSEASVNISGITGNAGETRKIKPTLTTGLVGMGWTF